jgi:hypothetical protein
MKRLATLLMAMALLFGACGGGGGGGSTPPPADSLQGTYSLAGFWLDLSTSNETFHFTEEDYAPVSGTLTIGPSSWSEVFTAGGETNVTTGTYTVSGDRVTLHTADGDDQVGFRFIDTVQYGHVLELHSGPYSLVDSPYQAAEEWDFWRKI